MEVEAESTRQCTDLLKFNAHFKIGGTLKLGQMEAQDANSLVSKINNYGKGAFQA